MALYTKQPATALRAGLESPQLSVSDDEQCEQLLPPAQMATKKRPSNVFTIVTITLLITLTVTNFILVAVIRFGPNVHRSSYRQVTPHFPWEQRIFEEDPMYAEPPSPQTERAWELLLPLGNGMIEFHHDGRLEPSPLLNQSLPTQQAFVASFHQMHCLDSLRKAVWTALDGDVDGVSRALVSHCTEYLRQSIMCHADPTIEWLEKGSRADPGWGNRHTCRSYEALKQWTESQRRDNGWA